MLDTVVNGLLMLIPNAEASVLEALTEQCIGEFKAACNRDDAPEAAAAVISQMVQHRYNQRGAEGLQSQSYSGMSESYMTDYPASLRRAMNRYRKVRML